MSDAAQPKPVSVVVLVPCAETADSSLDYYNDYSQSHDEFARAFADLGLEWRWQPVTSRNYRAVIDAVAGDDRTSRPIVFNLCDGDESNDVPGVSVIRYLDEVGLTYTGADAMFYQATTSKIDMKRAFDAAGVATAPWSVIENGRCDAADLFERLGRPLIVKPAVAAGSMGITIKSVVESEVSLCEQARQLHDGYHGWRLDTGGVLAERFIVGPEFTTFIIGSADDRERARIYPPVERVFHEGLPPTERFLSYDRLWEVYERESPMPDGGYLWEYQPAPDALSDRICEVSWAAYAAVGGCGYGRIDLRMEAATGELYVLEVNAQCGLSEDEDYTSIGAILRFGNHPFSGVLSEIMATAVART